MSEAGEFIDLSLQREASWRRAEQLQSRLETEPAGSGLRFYGTSVGAVRGTVRDAGRRYPGLSRDEVAALSSELWGSELEGSDLDGSNCGQRRFSSAGWPPWSCCRTT